MAASLPGAGALKAGAEGVFDSLLKKAKNFNPEAESELEKLLKKKPKPKTQTQPEKKGRPGRPVDTKTGEREERGDGKFVLKFSDAMNAVDEVLNATAFSGPKIPDLPKDPRETSKAIVDWFDDLSDELVFGANETKQIKRIEDLMRKKLLTQKNARHRKSKTVRTRVP